MVMMSTSRFAMCDSSCASTLSISCGSSRRQSPVVTATAACLGLRPVANAFGTSLSTIAIRGFGRSAMAHSRSTTACSSGASSGATTLAPEPATPAFKLKGDPTAGAKIFQSAGCVGCHTLAAAHATGTVGPNLDQAKPDYRKATARVTLGKGAMPSFKSQLSTQEIANVASYVVKSTGG